MAVDKRELVQKIYDYSPGDSVQDLLPLFDPQVTVRQTELLPWGGEFHGIEGLGRFLTLLRGQVRSTPRPDEWIEAGDQVVAIGSVSGRVNATGRDFNVRFIHVWTVSGGKIKRFEPYIDTPGMLRALEI